MARASLACQLVLLAVTAPLYQPLGLSFAWETAFRVLPLAMLVVVWVHLCIVPDKRQNAVVTDLFLAVFVTLLFTNIASPAQYAAVALKRPLIDGWLASADAALGIHVPSLVEWTRVHPRVNLLLTVSYSSLLAQFILAPVGAALLLRDRRRLWEYVFHFHFCLIVTLAALAAFPAECAFTHYGFESTLNQTRFINQFQALRDGSFAVIRFDDLEGLISMPSFHAAGAMMVTWVFRGHRRWLVPIALLNVGLLAGTVMSGAHYFVDVLAAGVVFLASLVAYRLGGSRLTPIGD
jgi:membrane-associated phospholipid phosphatase